ncbi:MAG: hypothetical protein HGA49_12495 [Eubacteriaceae bacterium]|nr:hypothetical protein [Eubacteriaceae bacterium]
MGFLDDIGKKASQAAKAIGEKSEELIEEGKTRVEIEKTEYEMKKQFKELGSKVFLLHKSGLILDESLSVNLKALDELERKLSALEIDEVNEK